MFRSLSTFLPPARVFLSQTLFFPFSSGVSECIILGAPVNLGTGLFDLLHEPVNGLSKKKSVYFGSRAGPSSASKRRPPTIPGLAGCLKAAKIFEPLKKLKKEEYEYRTGGYVVS